MDLELHAKKLVEDVFALKRNENFLIITEEFDETINISTHDKVRWKKLESFVVTLYNAIKGYFPNTSLYIYSSTKGSGKEPQIDVWEKAFGIKITDAFKKDNLINKIINKNLQEEDYKKIDIVFSENNTPKYSAIMAITNFSTTHTNFRKLLTDKLGVRYASMPLFEPDMFKTSMRANYKELEELTIKVANKLNNYESFHVKAENGTDLYIFKDSRKVKPDTGNLKQFGTYSNLPAGEAFFAPLEGKSKGTLVLEYSVTRKLDSPIILNIDDGRLVKITGSEPYADELKRKIEAHPNNKNLAEMGFGTNKYAVMIDNILEAEKIYGTVHFAFGDNKGFGGNTSAPFHEDYIILYPNVSGIKNGAEELVMENREFIL
jgi:leucyl aminopeptidase (aminopeptidase T)